MTNRDDDNNHMDGKPAALPFGSRKRKPPPRLAGGGGEGPGTENIGSAAKPGSVPVTPHAVKRSGARLSPRILSPKDFSPLTVNGTFSPARLFGWETDLLPIPPEPAMCTEPKCTYVKIPHRETGFNPTTWWLVDLHHQPPMEQGATSVVARCLQQYRNWDETLARRVLKGYKQYLALATDAEDWRSCLLLAPPLVDQLWSIHTQDLTAYCHDCMILCGQVLNRNLNSADEEQRQNRTLRLLKQKFGIDYDPEIWAYSASLASAVVDEVSKPNDVENYEGELDGKPLAEAVENSTPEDVGITAAAVNILANFSLEKLANTPESFMHGLEEVDPALYNEEPLQQWGDGLEVGEGLEDQSVTLFPELKAQAASDIQNTDSTSASEKDVGIMNQGLEGQRVNLFPELEAPAGLEAVSDSQNAASKTESEKDRENNKLQQKVKPAEGKDKNRRCQESDRPNLDNAESNNRLVAPQENSNRKSYGGAMGAQLCSQPEQKGRKSNQQHKSGDPGDADNNNRLVPRMYISNNETSGGVVCPQQFDVHSKRKRRKTNQQHKSGNPVDADDNNGLWPSKHNSNNETRGGVVPVCPQQVDGHSKRKGRKTKQQHKSGNPGDGENNNRLVPLEDNNNETSGGVVCPQQLHAHSKEKGRKTNQKAKSVKQLEMYIPMIYYSSPKNPDSKGTNLKRKVHYTAPLSKRRYATRDLSKIKNDFRYRP